MSKWNLSEKIEIIKELESMGISKGYITRIIYFFELKEKKFIRLLKELLIKNTALAEDIIKDIDKLAGDSLK